jgi:hypothetical protein
MPASISQAGLEVGILEPGMNVRWGLSMLRSGRNASVSRGAEPSMVRAVENEGRALGAEMGELKNLKE